MPVRKVRWGAGSMDAVSNIAVERFRAFGTTRVYLMVWVAALIFAITGPVATLIVAPSGRASMWAPYGVTAGFQGNHIWEVFGPEARAAGIAPLDRVVAIEGISVEGVGLRRIREALNHKPGEAVLLAIRHPDGTAITARLHSQSANLVAGEATKGVLWEKRPWWIIGPLTASAFMWVLASVLLFSRRRDPMAALFSITFLLLTSYGASERLFYEFGFFNLQLVLALTGFSLAALGILIFPSGRFEPRWTRWVAMFLPVYAIVGFIFSEGNNAAISGSYFVLELFALAAIIHRYRASSSDTEKQQIRWFLFGLVASAICVLCQSLTRYVFEMSTSSPAWTSVLPIMFTVAGSATFLGGLVVSLLKYRLYDANAVIERSVTFGILTLGLLAIFAGSEKVIEVLGEEYFGERLGALAGGLGAAVAAVMIVPLHHRITHWAEHRFQKGLRRLRLDLPLIVGDQRETATVERIADTVLDEIAAGLRDHRAALILGDSVVASRGMGEAAIDDWRRDWIEPRHADLVCDKTDPVFPLRLPLDASGHERVGWLLMGPRPDGSFYGKDEREALSEIADPVARALAIANHRAEEKTRVEQRLNEVLERVEVLETRLSAKVTDPS